MASSSCLSGLCSRFSATAEFALTPVTGAEGEVSPLPVPMLRPGSAAAEGMPACKVLLLQPRDRVLPIKVPSVLTGPLTLTVPPFPGVYLHW